MIIVFNQKNKGASENAIKKLEIAIVEATRLRLDFLILMTSTVLMLLDKRFPF